MNVEEMDTNVIERLGNVFQNNILGHYGVMKIMNIK